jgi:hypothetical protein
MKIWIAVTACLCGCIKAPEIVMVDRATALEQQASGSFDELERELSVGAVGARSLPLTPNQLEALGIMPSPIVDQTELTEPDRLDALLVQRCVGEGMDGLLVDTHDDCIGAADRNLALALIDRTNRARVQLWQWMQKERPEQSVDALRAKWREQHARGVVCRGWVQRTDGTWGPKAC